MCHPPPAAAAALPGSRLPALGLGGPPRQRGMQGEHLLRPAVPAASPSSQHVAACGALHQLFTPASSIWTLTPPCPAPRLPACSCSMPLSMSCPWTCGHSCMQAGTAQCHSCLQPLASVAANCSCVSAICHDTQGQSACIADACLPACLLCLAPGTHPLCRRHLRWRRR